MSHVFLVRHAQASFLEPDYDKLSPTGETQAHLLGEYWASRNIAFDSIYTGPRVRQIDTAKIVAGIYRRLGVAFPEPVAMVEFDEYQWEDVLRNSIPKLVETDAEMRGLHGAFQSAVAPEEKRSTFQRMFEGVVGKWVDGELVLPDVESWPEFCARVNRGLSKLTSRGLRGEQVAVFSSGGPIGVAMQRALNLSPRDTLRVTWMSRNCSYSEFLCSGERFTLSAFNATPHLDDPSLLTYR
ncbi:MAG: histidine phosphatase family protein [Bryobacteraceae bacterium]